MSPEQARGEFVDQRSDLFSLGSVLYTACTGRPPFRSEAAYGILRRITDTDPRPIREINANIPEWLCGVIERLMAKHPADRYSSAGEIAEMLDGCLAHLQQPTEKALPQCITLPPRDDTVFPHNEQPSLHTNGAAKPRSLRFLRTGVLIMASFLLLAAISFTALQLTQPMDIAGTWKGDSWQDVTLSSVEEATDWYTGAFTDSEGRRGAIQLEWSRFQRRYNGRWKVGDEQSGAITLRVNRGELRGAVSVDPDSRIDSSTPRLREFSWQRASANMEQRNVARERKAIGSPTPVQSPVKGCIVRWRDRIHENARVEEGEVIALIEPLNDSSTDQIQRQLEAAESKIQSASDLVHASERNRVAAKDGLNALEPQLEVYQQAKDLAVAAAKAAVESAGNKAAVEEAKLIEYQAAFHQCEADFARKKQLLEEKLVSESAFEEANRKLQEATANVVKAEASVTAAKTEVKARQKDEKAQEAKAQADIETIVLQMNQAKETFAQSEQDVAKANLELKHAEKEVFELQTKLSRLERFQIVAPHSGVVAEVTKNTLVKEFDTICVIWPEKVAKDSEAQSRGSANLNASQPRVENMGLSGKSGWRSTETIDAAIDLGRRFRTFRVELAKAEPLDASPAFVASINKDLAATESQRIAFVSILKAHLDAANKQNDSQTALRNSVQQRVKDGREPRNNLSHAEQAVTMSSAEIRQLELLLEYCQKLGNETYISPEDEKNFAIEVIKTKLEAAKKNHRFLADQRSLAKQRFELGELELEQVLKADQDEATAAAEARRIEAILVFYSNLDAKD